jgi:hypothetical protein
LYQRSDHRRPDGNVFWPEQFGGIGVWYGKEEYADEPVNIAKTADC